MEDWIVTELGGEGARRALLQERASPKWEAIWMKCIRRLNVAAHLDDEREANEAARKCSNLRCSAWQIVSRALKVVLAKAAYNKLVKELEDEETERNQNIVMMVTDKAGKIGEHGDTEASRATAKSGLDGVLASIASLEPSCNYFTVNFQVRVKNRQIERDGLEKAKAILQGAEFGNPTTTTPAKKRKWVPRWTTR
ncbi:unnamed protein product [Prorocentrum cordatum]|uniref:Uncharacterized protein n=1 Tax=Prorocentrum cordatum TaxID=2364126 RepID=A0ABN9Q937_9DINO|nr:unnamed protein product [Polarella glacialis]